jgi:DTW domain-containing protein YfiP
MCVGRPATLGALKQIRLKIKVEVVLCDNIKKATGLHAKLVAPDDVTITQVADVTGLSALKFDPADTLLVFPSDDAVPCQEIMPGLSAFKRLVLVDTSWQKTKSFVAHPSLAKLKRVQLQNPPKASFFWRWHDKGANCISTIEALLYILIEYADAITGSATEDCSELQLLYFFAMQSKAIAKQTKKRGAVDPMSEQVKAARASKMHCEATIRRQQARVRNEKGKKEGEMRGDESRVAGNFGGKEAPGQLPAAGFKYFAMAAAAHKNMPLSQFAPLMFPAEIASRSQAKRAAEQRRFAVNGITRKHSYRVSEGEQITLLLHRPADSEVTVNGAGDDISEAATATTEGSS